MRCALAAVWMACSLALVPRAAEARIQTAPQLGASREQWQICDARFQPTVRTKLRDMSETEDAPRSTKGSEFLTFQRLQCLKNVPAIPRGCAEIPRVGREGS